jgi:hypothetical protein
MGKKIKWNEGNLIWNANPYLWNEVEIATEVIGSGGGVLGAIRRVEDLPEEKKKRFIRLICKVKGIETYSGQKTIREDIKITAEDIKLVAKEVLGIDLTAENIHV